MLKKFVVVVKYLGVATGILLGVISCENDFRNVGVSIVDNNIFSTNSYVSEVISYSKNIEKNQTNGLFHYLLGVQRDDIFGKLEASIVAQLNLPETNPDFGTNAVLDSVVIDIPYLATLNGTNSNDTPNFDLDSIWTTGDKTIQLNVFELGTYLSSVDPNDPTETKKYFSDDDFDKVNPGSPLFSGVIAPSAIDTVLFVKRYKYPNYPDLTTKNVYTTDTIKKTDTKPSLKIPLDKEAIQTIIQDNASSSDFASNANFQHFFRGLYFEALETTETDASLMTLSMSDATMTLYYSNDVVEDEGTDEDLDGNGVTGETGVTVRTPESFIFPLTGVKANLYDRDYNGDFVESYITTANEITGEEILFTQGAGGVLSVIKLFGDDANSNEIPDELEMLREKNWLINDAQLVLYINPNNATNWTPERLFIYNLKNELDPDPDAVDTQLLDALPQSIGALNGTLVRNEDDEPEKYIFHLTDFISEIIKSDTELVLYDLGLKVYNESDSPDTQVATDTIVASINTNPKGIVLNGNLPISEENRIKLEIYYSEKN